MGRTLESRAISPEVLGLIMRDPVETEEQYDRETENILELEAPYDEDLGRRVIYFSWFAQANIEISDGSEDGWFIVTGVKLEEKVPSVEVYEGDPEDWRSWWAECTTWVWEFTGWYVHPNGKRAVRAIARVAVDANEDEIQHDDIWVAEA
jgi:hypothetical protein